MDVVDDGRLEIGEEQVQMGKFHGEKGRSREAKKVLMDRDLIEDVIFGQCHLKLKGNQEANSITEAAVLKCTKRIKFGIFVC